MMPTTCLNESRRQQRCQLLSLWKICLCATILLIAVGIAPQTQAVAAEIAAVPAPPLPPPASAVNNVIVVNKLSTVAAESAATTSVAATTITSTFIADGSGAEGSSSNSNSGTSHRFNGFSALDKEVVERLIKQWAPVVWLAPEEKFLPLGVDEFLNHVHPADKKKAAIRGMPIGDNSMKTFLVTNAEIDDLLDNDNSFIYGRNPNESPVPIYAVVSLCGATQTNEPVSPQQQQPYTPQQQQQQQPYTPQQLQQQYASQMLPSTRGPYIPVSLDPYDDRNNTVRRSSRLYPVFKRTQRDAPAFISAAGISPIIPAPSTFGLVMGEATRSPQSLQQQQQQQQQLATAASSTEDSSETSDNAVNNFIANLADNVKFSGVSGDESDNSIGGADNEPATDHMFAHRPQVVPGFHVTYWMFYPYSQGKTMCTLSLGPLGRIPFPAVYGFCLGRRKDIGSHIGDWEHMSLYFNGAAEPDAMYVSAHDAGAYYSYNRLTGSFEFKKQETRKGILQRPNFPKTVTTFNNHPVLFAAKGSHGLWTAPGKHRFVKVARLYDINGFGTPWNTWKAVDITYENLQSYGRSLIPNWLSFKGKWGNPKSNCHPFRRIGLNFCEYMDGPTGIPLKEPHFQCAATKTTTY